VCYLLNKAVSALCHNKGVRHLQKALSELSSHLLRSKKASSAVWVVRAAEVPRVRACRSHECCSGGRQRRRGDHGRCSSSGWSCSDEKGVRHEHAMGKKKMCHDGLLQEKRRWPAVALSGGCCSALLGNTARGRRTGGCLAQAFCAGRRQREER
jgi:hypothetical protein